MRQSQEQLLRIAYQAIQEGRGDAAETALEGIVRKDVGVSLLWVHRYQLVGDLERLKILDRQAINRSHPLKMRELVTPLLK